MSDQLLIRIDEDLKRAFIASCKGQDQTASQVLRAFVRSYVAQNGQAPLFPVDRKLSGKEVKRRKSHEALAPGAKRTANQKAGGSGKGRGQ
ncbi:type II toxin-antitoxin system RelB/DinJ family antitoxin [Sedimenticola sp.]|uniref:type II toxin-antitoxin system RelB/DinJ family antitoxin n=1 Tax=Sedimenticola sp. TaxID=1940285 RepID=UPI003D0C6688